MKGSSPALRETYFALTKEPDGWWVEYSTSRSGLKTTGPFRSAADAIRFGDKKGWTFLRSSSL